MRAGEAKHLITLEQRAAGVSSSGDANGSWSTLAQVRAIFRGLPARERFSSALNRPLSAEAGTFRVRRDSRIYAEDGTDKWTRIRISFRGKYWNVFSIAPIVGTRDLEIGAEVIS